MQNRLQSASAAPPLLDSPEQDAVFLSTSQKAALTQLSAMVRLSAGQDSYGGFRIRTAPLLSGETGAGKTTVVRRCAKELGDDGKPYPLLGISTPGWIIVGARTSGPGTLSLIRSFVRKHDRGILHLDEIDKGLPAGAAAWSETWCVCLLGEVLSLMDGKNGDDRLLGAGWTREDIDRLSNFVIVGSGTWQRALEKSEKDGTSHAEAIEEEPLIPPELMRRFSQRHIQISLPTKADFIEALRGVYEDLGLPARDSMIDVVSDAATASGLGFRFTECHIVDLLIRYPHLQRPRAKSELKTVSRSVPIAHYEAQKQDVYGQIAALQPAIAHLRIQVKLHHAHFFPPRQEPDPFNEKASGGMEFDQRCLDLLAALQLAYATTDQARYDLEVILWKNAHAISGFVGSRLDQDLPWLANHNLMSLFTVCQLRLSRMIAAWQHLTSLEAAES